MLDVTKLKEIAHKIHLTEEEFVAEKKRLVAKILHKNEPVQPKNGVIYILLAFFLGTTGIHNFYAGYWGRGLSQLCLTLISAWFLYIPLLFVAMWALLELLFVNKSAKGINFSGNRTIIISLRIISIVLLALAFSNTPMVMDEPDFEEVIINI
ncbi:MAG: TM2 domain-containing protein [Alphaproteobacteria bacterium]|nr:TM2 domain-containing protein [Alphaproteobacteria bacterium]